MQQPSLFCDKENDEPNPQSNIHQSFDNIVYFDTETTGLGPQHRLCQLAYKTQGVEYESLFKPPLPIDPGASAVTGITDQTVATKEEFIGSSMATHFSSLARDTEKIFVAHNAEFDVEMLRREGIKITRFFDTLRIARIVDNGEAENYKQEYLREYYDLDVDDAKAHDALGDVKVLEALYKKLSSIILQNEDYSNDIITEMTKMMEEPILYKKLTFGKYKGQLIEEVLQIDKKYLEWLLGQKKSAAANGQKDSDWLYTLNHYLEKNK